MAVARQGGFSAGREALKHSGKAARTLRSGAPAPTSGSNNRLLWCLSGRKLLALAGRWATPT